MRALLSAVVVLSLGCGAGAVPAIGEDGPPCGVTVPTAKERLEAGAVTFLLQPGASFGSFSARRLLFDDPAIALPLTVREGRLVMEAGVDAYGELLTVSRYEAQLADVQFPPALLPPSGLELTQVSFRLMEPATLRVHWLGGGAVGTASGTLPIEFHSSLRLASGGASPLEVGRLPAVPVDLVVERTANGVLLLSSYAHLGGGLWRWGNFFELGDVTFAADANEAAALLELPTTATSLAVP